MVSIRRAQVDDLFQMQRAHGPAGGAPHRLGRLAEDNILQVWQMTESIYTDDGDEDHAEGDVEVE